MVPKLHAKGSSFKGVAAYLLHDKGRAQTNERVDWVETRNLATRDGEVAWRVMAATAMDQDRLKEQAGVKNTGRKSKDAVLHFTLSWHPDEKEKLTRDEMRRAALGAIRALGAEDRQAFFISHGDEEQPHVHVVINRVSDKDGRMLSSSKEKLNLSRWAEGYEKERGQIYCENRVINNAARDRDEYTRGKKDKTRNIYEIEAANDNSAKAEAIQEEHRRKAAELAKRQREIEARHKKEWAKLDEAHRRREVEIEREAKRLEALSVSNVRSDYRQSWQTLFHEDQAEMRAFEQREEKLFGRVQNAFKAIDFTAIVRGADRRKAISEAFQTFSDAGKRLEGVKAEQDRRARDLLAKQRKAEAEAVRRIEAQRQAALRENRARLMAERNDLILAQEMDGAKLRAQWMIRSQLREQAWEDFRKPAEVARQPNLKPDLSDLEAKRKAFYKRNHSNDDKKPGRSDDRER